MKNILSIFTVKKLLIIDGNHLIHRAFWAIPSLNAKDGTPTNAVFGFFSTLMNLIIYQKPDFLVITFDSKEKTFRHEKDENYKATRKESPDELISQIVLIQDIVKESGIPMAKKPGVEADDLIATLVATAEKENEISVQVYSGDMDTFQLISDKTHVLLPQNASKGIKEVDETAFQEKYEITTDQIADYKALVGDPSDNLKGVAGVGKKTAVKLINEFHSLDNIYENIENIKSEKLREKLLNDKESAYHAKSMATLLYDVDMELDIEKSTLDSINFSKVEELFHKYDLVMLIRRFQKLKEGAVNLEISQMAEEIFSDASEKESSQKKSDQLSLFS